MSDPEDGDGGIEHGVGTERYRTDTTEYSASEEDADADGAPDDKVPFWKRHGFESFSAWIAHLEDHRPEWELVPPRSEVPDVRPPGDEIAAIGRPVTLEPRLRQVNVKLRSDEGAALDEAAEIYGLAPTTLARLLVNRGVKAILADYGGGGD